MQDRGAGIDGLPSYFPALLRGRPGRGVSAPQGPGAVVAQANAGTAASPGRGTTGVGEDGTERPEVSAREEEQMRRNVSMVLQRMQNVVPFLILFFLKKLYQHSLGICFFFAYTSLIFNLNHRFSNQVALKNDQNRGAIAMIVAVSVTAVVLAYSILNYMGDPKAYQRLMLYPLPKSEPNLEDVLWAIAASDVIVRLIFLAIKASFALGSPFHWPFWLGFLKRLKGGEANTSGMVSGGNGAASGGDIVSRSSNICVHTRKRRVYCLCEAVSITYRSLLPVPAWCQYYANDAVYGQVFVSVYLVLKILVLARHFRAVFGAFQSVASNTLEFGAYASKEEHGCCPICYDDMENPVILPCLHVFCEGCLSYWLERERTCPVCRGEVESNLSLADRLRTSSTSMWPCIL